MLSSESEPAYVCLDCGLPGEHQKPCLECRGVVGLPDMNPLLPSRRELRKALYKLPRVSKTAK